MWGGGGGGGERKQKTGQLWPRPRTYRARSTRAEKLGVTLRVLVNYIFLQRFMNGTSRFPPSTLPSPVTLLSPCLPGSHPLSPPTVKEKYWKNAINKSTKKLKKRSEFVSANLYKWTKCQKVRSSYHSCTGGKKTTKTINTEETRWS